MTFVYNIVRIKKKKKIIYILNAKVNLVAPCLRFIGVIFRRINYYFLVWKMYPGKKNKWKNLNTVSRLFAFVANRHREAWNETSVSINSLRMMHDWRAAAMYWFRLFDFYPYTRAERHFFSYRKKFKRAPYYNVNHLRNKYRIVYNG